MVRNFLPVFLGSFKFGELDNQYSWWVFVLEKKFEFGMGSSRPVGIVLELRYIVLGQYVLLFAFSYLAYGTCKFLCSLRSMLA